MIPAAAITEWSNKVPWADPYYVEQDLVISRCLVSMFQDDFLASRLAFRGGTALHKLYLPPQVRYSSDIEYDIDYAFEVVRDVIIAAM
ncbi:MAG: nucleotidyl transferase AbiEii/AbiGii toxin family protein [Coriobacteriales bacterium]|jgi:predicted nucleotidyltransferase component of viral defense system|nr:nucleotidyl transferase AbiEii/AbiGii toxin family protein [Coriobacteriales bacterium]